MMLFTPTIMYRGRRTAPPGLVVPTINFVAGVASSHDLTQYVQGWNASTMELVLQGTALPAHVTFNGTSLVFDGDASTTQVTGVKLVLIYIGV